jgi:hypothetical protein
MRRRRTTGGTMPSRMHHRLAIKPRCWPR